MPPVEKTSLPDDATKPPPVFGRDDNEEVAFVTRNELAVRSPTPTPPSTPIPRREIKEQSRIDNPELEATI
jgi:hypothetical protein